MNINYATLADDLASGALRQELAAELTTGFRLLQQEGERLPVASHYASRIAEIIHHEAPEPIVPDLSFYVYQEVLLAVEQARATVMGEPVLPA